MADGLGVLKPPAVKRVRYKRNFIKTAVCELRFPVLLELEARPPREFQSKIRRAYPFYEPQIVDPMGPADEVAREHRYLFRSKDRHWTVSVKSFAFAIETSKYIDFEDFFARFKEIFGHAKGIIDADFFTRVGLRYINLVPIEDGNLDGWIRPDLIAPLTGGVLGEIKKAAAVVQGAMENGEYSIRHGLRTDPSTLGKGDATPAVEMPATSQHYQLDFDYYAENVELTDVESLIQKFNETNFAVFHWCLGEKALKLLGEGKAK